MKYVEKEIRKRMNKIAELNLAIEKERKDSLALQRMESNALKIKILEAEVSRIAEENGFFESVSSDDGTFTGYKTRVRQVGVDPRIYETGIIEWLYENHPEYLVPDLIRIRDELGIDLSGFAKRAAYDKYAVSEDKDFRYVMEILEDYIKRKEETREALASKA